MGGCGEGFCCLLSESMEKLSRVLFSFVFTRKGMRLSCRSVPQESSYILMFMSR